jgi:broad specificity phosphatase PhoE
MRPTSGESYAQAVERVAAFLDDLDGPSVIVCHGGILRATQYLHKSSDGRDIVDTPVPQDRLYIFDGDRAYWSN